MKYKVIKLEDNKSVLVDESAEIKSDEHYVAWEDNYKIPQWVIYVRGVGLNGKAPYKVLYTINFSLDKDIPMIIVEDEIEKLALEWCLINNFNPEDYVHSNKTAEYSRVKSIWANGYKASQKLYSEQDLRKAIDEARDIREGEEVFDVESISGLTEICTYNWVINKTEDEIIQSLKQEYIELEMEYLSNDGNWKDVLLPSEWDAYTKNRIKTDRVNGQLMAYVKQ